MPNSLKTDHTHDGTARSWVGSANGHAQFPIQNLPLGIFAPDGADLRPGVAIGDSILDLRALAAAGHLPAVLGAFDYADLKPFLALGAEARQALRHALFALLSADYADSAVLQPHLHDAARCALALPMRPGGYTDFYAGIVHATNVGRLLRPDNPLMPNYKYIPIGYHGRTSSIRPSGTDVRRPNGQLKGPGDAEPRVGPSARVDYEVELGLWIGEGNALGDPIAIGRAGDHLAGVTILNDWSARDIQAWEYQPLGPFLAKNFASTVSPWLVTAEALAPFRSAQIARPAGDPAPLPYLLDEADQATGAFDIAIDVAVRTAAMRDAGVEPLVVGRTSARHMYWTPAQLIAHHSSNGCPLEPGDLLGTGTISAPQQDGFGSLMEITSGGKQPFVLGDDEERRFLEDGDEVVMTARCSRDGFAAIGFGECRAIILPAPALEGHS